MSPVTNLFWMTSELPGFSSWKNGSYRYLFDHFKRLLGEKTMKNVAIDHVTTHRVWIIIIIVNVYLFCLVKPKLYAVWFCFLMCVRKSLHLCKYVGVITRCCLSICLNSFLSSRTWGKTSGRFHRSPNSREPKAEAKVKGFFLLLAISWLSLQEFCSAESSPILPTSFQYG